MTDNADKFSPEVTDGMAAAGDAVLAAQGIKPEARLAAKIGSVLI